MTANVRLSTIDICSICLEDPTNPISPSNREKKITRFMYSRHNPARHTFESELRINNVCQHVFCQHCLSEWMREERNYNRDNFCPICRKKYTVLLPPNDSHVTTVTEEGLPEDSDIDKIWDDIVVRLKDDKKFDVADKLSSSLLKLSLRRLKEVSPVDYYKLKLIFFIERNSLLLRTICISIIGAIVLTYLLNSAFFYK